MAQHRSPRDPGSTCATAYPCSGGTSCIYPGEARAFAIPPYNPSPADGATDVPLNATLHYSFQFGTCTCLGSACSWLHFGVDPDPPLFFHDKCGSEDVPFPELDLKPSTTYYWRAGADFCGTVIGPIWSFTTAPTLGVEAVTWSNVKKVFR